MTTPLRQGLKDMDFPLPRLKKLWGYLILEKDFQLVGGLEHVFFPYIGNNHPKYWLKTPTSQDLNGSFSFPNDFAPVFWTNDDRASRSISKEFGHPKHQAYSDFRTFTQGELGKLVNMAKWRNVPGTWKDWENCWVFTAGCFFFWTSGNLMPSKNRRSVGFWWFSRAMLLTMIGWWKNSKGWPSHWLPTGWPSLAITFWGKWWWWPVPPSSPSWSAST